MYMYYMYIYLPRHSEAIRPFFSFVPRKHSCLWQRDLPCTTLIQCLHSGHQLNDRMTILNIQRSNVLISMMSTKLIRLFLTGFSRL